MLSLTRTLGTILFPCCVLYSIMFLVYCCQTAIAQLCWCCRISCRLISCCRISCRCISCRLISCRWISCCGISFCRISCRLISCRLISDVLAVVLLCQCIIEMLFRHAYSFPFDFSAESLLRCCSLCWCTFFRVVVVVLISCIFLWLSCYPASSNLLSPTQDDCCISE